MASKCKQENKPKKPVDLAAQAKDEFTKGIAPILSSHPYDNISSAKRLRSVLKSYCSSRVNLINKCRKIYSSFVPPEDTHYSKIVGAIKELEEALIKESPSYYLNSISDEMDSVSNMALEMISLPEEIISYFKGQDVTRIQSLLSTIADKGTFLGYSCSIMPGFKRILISEVKTMLTLEVDKVNNLRNEWMKKNRPLTHSWNRTVARTRELIDRSQDRMDERASRSSNNSLLTILAVTAAVGGVGVIGSAMVKSRKEDSDD